MYEAIKKTALSFLILSFYFFSAAQDLPSRLQAAYASFESDSQLSSALSSLYVIDAKTGAVVFARNERIGMATASTLKVITAATAYEVLGRDFRYATELGYTGQINKGVLNGSFYIRGSGDPTLGSWRWPATGDSVVLSRILASIRALGIKSYHTIVTDEKGWEGSAIPDGWIWQDIGNYYGAAAGSINWHENQYDLILSSGVIRNTEVGIVKIQPHLYSMDVISYARSAPKGTGDQTYIYLPLGSTHAELRGTIPVGEKSFTVSGATLSGRDQLIGALNDSLSAMGMRKTAESEPLEDGRAWLLNQTVIHTEQSPPLDSIVYWFLKKSINLYGEALLKTIAGRQMGLSTTQKGVEFVRNFWAEKGIQPTELNIVDGSGLSPLDRVTTRAQVAVLRYAQKQPWFAGYYNAFPEYNGMKMKSGTIGGVKSFCGYQHSTDGHDYIFSFLVNNYNGPASRLIGKMYAVLDNLK